MNNLKDAIAKQIAVLTTEVIRVKEVVNTNGFDVTTAPYAIVKRYRDELKAHIRLLRTNLQDMEDEALGE